MISILSFATVVALSSNPAAAPDPCAGLDAGQRTRLAALLAREHPYACCDQTIAECLAAPRVCRLAIRLRRNVCRRLVAGEADGIISRALARRARSMLGLGGPVSIDLSRSPSAGDPTAPVTVVAYADANGPNCARLMPPLFRAVTEGPLRGKAKLHVKPFPLRKHPHAKEGGLALLAAAELGRFWELALDLWQRYPGFSPEKLPAWAAALGLDPDRLAARMADPDTLTHLRASKQEGLDHGVTSTPALFIDGQRFDGDNRIDELIDVIEEAFDRATRMTYAPSRP